MNLVCVFRSVVLLRDTSWTIKTVIEFHAFQYTLTIQLDSVISDGVPGRRLSHIYEKEAGNENHMKREQVSEAVNFRVLDPASIHSRSLFSTVVEQHSKNITPADYDLHVLGNCLKFNKILKVLEYPEVKEESYERRR